MKRIVQYSLILAAPIPISWISFFLFSILLGFPLAAQNLVPNPDFEQFLTNPMYSASGVNEAPGWSSLEHTTDFFHTQYEAPFTVPINFRGKQVAASGNGYAGIIAYDGNGASHEFLVAKLSEPLLPDQIYDLSFEASLSEDSRYGVDGIGAFVLDEMPTQLKMSRGAYDYSVRNEYGRVLSDTVQWVRIEGQFRADGGEQYLVIGGHIKDSPISFSDIINPDIPWAYFFIDDVYLAPCPKPVIFQQALDTALCAGQTLTLRGLDDAKNHRWQSGGVKQELIVRNEGLYVLDNHYDCEVIQQHFRVSFDDCLCDIRLPTLYSHAGVFNMPVSPIVLSWDLKMYDGSGRFVLETDDEQGLDPILIPAVSAPYFWVAQLSCVGPDNRIFSHTVSGKTIIQN